MITFQSIVERRIFDKDFFFLILQFQVFYHLFLSLKFAQLIYASNLKRDKFLLGIKKNYFLNYLMINFLKIIID